MTRASGVRLAGGMLRRGGNRPRPGFPHMGKRERGSWFWEHQPKLLRQLCQSASVVVRLNVTMNRLKNFHSRSLNKSEGLRKRGLIAAMKLDVITACGASF